MGLAISPLRIEEGPGGEQIEVQVLVPGERVRGAAVADQVEDRGAHGHDDEPRGQFHDY